ncbi:hypothetical protein GGR57DRAFT_519303 [Xylariaceae sp. FL1272]|nr:hypothetical protein GGR57DRAFT_519303 [Xylariaceae sp. FL1272]
MFSKAQLSKLPLLTTLLTVVFFALAVVFSNRWSRDVSQWPFQLPIRPYTFVDHAAFRDLDDDEAAVAWNRTVHLAWYEAEWRDETGRRFLRGIDVFHKIHCLVAIRKQIVILATADRQEDRSLEPRATVDLIENVDHMEHCFDFIRQDILCAADMTLEPLTEDYKQTDGQGIEHQCKDWRILLDIMDLPDMDEI